LKARANGRYLSRVLLFHSGSSDPVEARLAIAQHAGFNIVQKIVTAENFKFDFKEIVAQALAEKCDQIMIGQSAIISAAELRKLGWALEETNIDLVVAPAVTEIAGPRLKVSNVEGLPLLHLEQPVFSGAAKATKRLLDLIISIFGVIVILPFLIIICPVLILFNVSGSGISSKSEIIITSFKVKLWSICFKPLAIQFRWCFSLVHWSPLEILIVSFVNGKSTTI
jgi:hypothetical protein